MILLDLHGSHATAANRAASATPFNIFSACALNTGVTDVVQVCASHRAGVISAEAARSG
jgi:hypothetical protein